MKLLRYTTLIILILLCTPVSSNNYKNEVTKSLRKYLDSYKAIGSMRVVKEDIDSNNKIYRVEMNNDFASLSFRYELIDSIETIIKDIIKPTLSEYEVEVIANKHNIRDLVPNYYRTKEDVDKSKNVKTKKKVTFISNKNQPYEITKGLKNRNIALWQSHGLYYSQGADRWLWQRARVMTTVEDKYTTSIVLPYLAPMLERAGANVFMPRERDYQTREVIVDNDGGNLCKGTYSEESSSFKSGGSSGFGYKRSYYIDQQNPFTEGTYRLHATDEDGIATWIPEIPESGWYWVSIAYKTVTNSIPDAKYIVRHAGGETEYTVNQRMGGGTWIYLGQFYFEKGKNSKTASVSLSSKSDYKGQIVADAVRWGGGMGNVARRPATVEEKNRLTPTQQKRFASIYEKSIYETSGRAKVWEAGRYWLQWAGAPKRIYNESVGMNDYFDDYSCRGTWVNWLNYGSHNAPDSVGLKIPIDVALAFHSDAGTALDSVIGTLGIYTTDGGLKTPIEEFPNGQSRATSRDLTDIIQTQIVEDIRATVNPKWTRRNLWDKAYKESRTSNVPAMLIELLSHQNFEDMKYGLDPRFKFMVSRSIYKGVIKYLAYQLGEKYVITPLPINSFALDYEVNQRINMSWRPTVDSLEKSAVATGYVIYSRSEGTGWDNGVYVDSCGYTVDIPYNKVMSYKVVAVNSGGASMDSEILSAYISPSAYNTVMVINGFDRVAAPEGFQSENFAGFPDWLDRGISDGTDLGYVGAQNDFDYNNKWISDDAAGWGQSNSNYDFTPIAGNTHDYPYLHGKAIAAAGYNFVSASRKAVEDSVVLLDKYSVVDLILGVQKETFYGGNKNSCEFETFSLNLQSVLRDYTLGGGSILVSGAYVVTDSWYATYNQEEKRKFLEEVLKVKWRADKAAQDGKVKSSWTPLNLLLNEIEFSQQLNGSIYAVEHPDAIMGADDKSFTAMRYTQNSNSAIVAYDGEEYRTIVSGFPFETIIYEKQRNIFMAVALKFLLK